MRRRKASAKAAKAKRTRLAWGEKVYTGERLILFTRYTTV